MEGPRQALTAKRSSARHVLLLLAILLLCLLLWRQRGASAASVSLSTLVAEAPLCHKQGSANPEGSLAKQASNLLVFHYTEVADPTAPSADSDSSSSATPSSWRRGRAPPRISFVGSEELHMSSHDCVGVLHRNRTCMFRNLYFSSSRTVLAERPSWEYYTSVDACASPQAVEQQLRQLREQIGVLFLQACAYSKDPRAYDMRIRVFQRRLLQERTVQLPESLLKAPAAGENSGFSAWLQGHSSPRMARSSLAEKLFQVQPLVSASQRRWARDQHETYYGPCKQRQTEGAGAGEKGGMEALSSLRCLPPGTGLLLEQPSFYEISVSRTNPGHHTWDDGMAQFTALLDLGMPEPLIAGMLTLYSDDPASMGQGYADVPMVRGMYRGLYPQHYPVLYHSMAREWMQAGRGDVLFRSLAMGACCRATHSTNEWYSVYQASKGMMARWRQHFLSNMGLLGGGGSGKQQQQQQPEWPRDLQPGQPLKIIVLQKPDKRRIVNAEQLVEALSLIPGVQVTLLDWASLGGFKNEVLRMWESHIIMGVDGTGMMGAFAMAPGSVYISIPTAGNWGFPSHLGEFMVNGCDHIRVLYLDPSTLGEASIVGKWDIHADLLLPIDRMLELVQEAVQLVRGGFPRPVPYPSNLNFAARAMVRVMRAYPQYYQNYADAWRKTGPVSDMLLHNPTHFWRTYIGEQPPADLLDIIHARGGKGKGSIPGWEGP